MRIKIKKPKLTGYQKKILYSLARFTITEASTKVGKTFSHLWWLFEEAHNEDAKAGYHYWWVAPVYSQSEIAFKRLKRRIEKTGVYYINESKLRIITPKGTIIQFKTAKDPNTLYGEDVYAVVFDEASRSKKESYEALYTTITATNGKMKLIGNYKGLSNWVTRLKKKTMNDPHYENFKITAYDAVKEGILSQDVIDQAQKDLPRKVFAHLYKAEDIESDDMLCTYEALNDLFTNSFVTGKEMFITSDIALQGSDKFRVYVWEGYKIIHQEELAKADPKQVEDKLKALAVKYKVPRRNICYDADGLGSYLSGYLKGAFAFHNNATPFKVKGSKVNYKNLKSQCGFLLAQKINESGMYFECDIAEEEVLEELEYLREWNSDDETKLQLMPKKEIKKELGRSPDHLDTLLMRMVFDVKPRSTAPKSRYI